MIDDYNVTTVRTNAESVQSVPPFSRILKLFFSIVSLSIKHMIVFLIVYKLIIPNFVDIFQLD